MSVSIGSLIGYLVLDDKLSPSLKIARGNIISMSKDLDGMGDSLKKASSAMLPISAAITAAGVAAFKFGKDFEKSLTQIETLVGLSAESVKEFKGQVLALSSETGKGPGELADALYFVTSAGLRGAEAMQTLTASAKGSALGLGETKVVADAATSAVNAYGFANLSADEAVRVLIGTVREGKAEADSIAGAMGRVIPVANSLGVSFQDVGAFIASTTRVGLNAEESATALRGALVTLTNPTKEQTDAFQQLSEKGLLPLGFNLESVRKKIREEGLAQGFMQLTAATKGNVEALTAIIGNVRAATGVLGAYGTQAQKSLQIQTAIRTNLDETNKGFEIVSKTVDLKWNQALANMEKVAVHAFDALRSSFVGFADGLTVATTGLDALVTGFEMLPHPIQLAIEATLGLTALAAPLLFGFGVAAKGISVAMDGAASAMNLLADAGPEVVTALSLVGQTALVFGAAFAGWKIGSAIADVKLFGKEQMSLGESFTYGLLKIEQWTGVLDASDKDIENSVLAQRNLGAEVTGTAKAFDDASIAAISYEQCIAAVASPTEQAKNMTALWNDSMTETQLSVMNLNAAQREAIQTGIKMGASTNDIAAGLSLSEKTVKAYSVGLEEANKHVDKFIENQRKSQEETAKLNNEFAAAQVQQTGTDLDARLAAADQWFKDEVAKIESVGEVYKAHYAALEARRDQMKQKELADMTELNGKSRESAQQEAETERAKYDKMLASGLTFSREVLDAQLDKVRKLEAAAKDYGHSFVGAQEQGAKAAKVTNDFFDHMYDTVQQTLERMGKLKDAISQTFSLDIKDLSKQDITAIQTKYDLHGANTGADPDVALRKRLGELQNLQGTYAPKSAQDYSNMISDQAQLQQLTRYFANKPDSGLATSPASVYPSATPVAPRSNSDVTASLSGSGTSASSYGGVVMNNYINGTGEQIARIIQDQVMGQLRVGRQFGAV
jgi:TP901 family phage tail tape measure protein